MNPVPISMLRGEQHQPDKSLATMALKHHTVILVPHTRARFRKWRFSNRQLIGAATTLVVLLTISGISIWSFFTNTVEEHQIAVLEEENRQLREVNQEFDTNIRELKGRLSEFEQRTRQLAIVAGLDSTASEQGPGVGGDDLDTRVGLLSEDLDSIRSSLETRHRRISATPAISPVRGILTSGYGYRNDPVTGERALHQAIDLSAAPGQPVVATADAIVLEAERSGRLGNSVILAHGFGITSRYGHLARFDVEPGQRVQRGDVIGYVGNTGRTTGFHLHYEIRVDGQPVNPLVYILDGKLRRS